LEQQQEIGAQLSRGGFDWQVIEPPQLGMKIGPSLRTNVLLGGILGLFLGGIAAFIRESMDDKIYDLDKLRETIALPILGTLPILPQLNSRSAFLLPKSFRSTPLLTTQVIGWLPFREVLDLTYKNIKSAGSATSLKSLAVTSSSPGEGKSTIAVGLALSAARIGQRVLLIDSDLRFSSLHEKLSLPNDEGLSTLLERKQDQPRLHSINSNLDILTAGPMSTDPLQLLNSQTMKDWMERFEQDYDFVILDAPPVLGMADAIEAAQLCDAVVMVCRLGKVSRSEVQQAVAGLSGVTVLGCIANCVESSIKGYGYTKYAQQTKAPEATTFQLLSKSLKRRN